MKKLATPQDEKDFYTETDETRLIDIIHRITNDELVQHAPRMAVFLTHEITHLRSDAIRALVSIWRLSQYVPTVITMLASESDPSVRGYAALSLSQYCADLPKESDQAVQIMRALAAATRDEDDDVASHAYDHLWYVDSVWAGGNKYADEPHLQRDQFDQALIEKYLKD